VACNLPTSEWHQLSICKSASRPREITMPACTNQFFTGIGMIQGKVMALTVGVGIDNDEVGELVNVAV